MGILGFKGQGKVRGAHTEFVVLGEVVIRGFSKQKNV